MSKLLLITSFLTAGIVFSQPSLIKIHEGQSFDMCGYVMTFDKIYYSMDKEHAELIFSKGGTGKPFSGGYTRGSMIDLGDTCHWFLYAIDWDKQDEKANIYISRDSSEIEAPVVKENSFMLYKFSRYMIDSYTYFIEDAGMSSAGKMFIIANKGDTGGSYSVSMFSEGDTLWLGGGSYIFENILTEVASNSNKVQYLTPSAAVFRRVYEDYPEYVIRKMKYYPKKKIDEAEYENTPVKIYLLKILDMTHMAMPVIEVRTGSGKEVYPFSVEREFQTEEEAIQYAREHSILDIDLDYSK